jgi:hypothetical protein
VRFYMYQPFRFMEESDRRLGLDVSDEAISEAQALDSIDEEEVRRSIEGYLVENPEFAESVRAATTEDAEERSPTIRRQVGRRVTEIPVEAVLNSPGGREAQRFLDSPAAREAQRRLSSPEAQAAMERLNSPEARVTMERLSSPEAQAAFERLNSPEVQSMMQHLNRPEVRDALKWLRGS